MSIRQGYYARWQGAEYEASPEGPRVRLYAEHPISGFAEVMPGRFVRAVPAEELDRFWYVRTVCHWQGEPFQVLAEHETWLRVEYIGGQAEVAARLGLEDFDIDVFQAWAPRAAVTDLHEERL